MKRAMVALVLGACGAGEGEPAVDSLALDDFPVAEVVQPLVMPDRPTADRGMLAIRSDGPVGLSGTWRARAGLCAEHGTLHVMVREGGEGIILLLVLPDSGARLGDYPAVQESGRVQVPASQVGIQRFVENRPQAWQADSGAVTLSAWTGNRVAGHFGLAVRSVGTNQKALVAGAFRDLALDTLGAAECAVSEPAGSR